MKILEDIFDLFFPPRCVVCNTIGSYLCPSCRKKIQATVPKTKKLINIKAINAVFDFHDPVIKKAIYAYKYEKLSAMTPILSEMMYRYIRKEKIKCNVLAFVPISRKRKSWRGFNQSELLAKNLAKKLKKPVFEDLIKVKDTLAQVGLGKKERAKNLTGAFECDDFLGLLKNKNVLLIDDVVTTGATITECAQLLKKAGARSVSALVIAKE